MLLRMKSLLVVLFVSACFTLNAQSILVPYRIKDKWGYSDLKGKIKIKPQFDNTYFFHGDYATVISGGRAGLINRSGKIVIPFNYSELTVEKNGIRATTKSGLTGYYDLNTKKLLVDTLYLGISVDGSLLLVMDKNYKRGIFDMHSKKWIAPVEYNMAEPIYNSSTVLVARNNQKYLIPVLPDGPGKITPYIEDYSDMEELIPVKIGQGRDSSRPIEATPSTIPPPAFYESRLFREENKYGFIFSPVLGSDSIPAMYDSIDRIKERERFLGVQNGGRWGIVNSKNQIILPLEYPTLDLANSDIPNNLFVVSINNKKTVITQTGAILAKDYDAVFPLTQSYILEKNGKKGLLIAVDRDAPVIIEPAFDYIINYVHSVPLPNNDHIKFWMVTIRTGEYSDHRGFISEKGVQYFKD
ncbi:WG repeat-containing protein [Terrimonas ferruginea]|uniref:WG repeat-containing protein n=1 Tax=Terrimonas ferruginea TaxID=249 RepID=UPI00040D6CD2|nr:WG repeat-containing protein [Terrimonas ferruginea]